jgi:heme oxygenase
VIQDVLRKRATLRGYALLMANLLPAYQALEQALSTVPLASPARLILRPELNRSFAISSDLETMCGPSWRERLHLLPAAQAYAARVQHAAQGDGARLIAHAYSRYLGDLSGGQILARLLTGSFGLTPSALTFYAFPGIPDVAAFKDSYRAALDAAGSRLGDFAAVVEEGAVAFQLNIDLSNAVQQAAADVTP